MTSHFHFDHHRREALTNRKRFSVASAFLLMIALSGFGIIVKQSSFAATSTTFDLNGYKINTSNSTTGPFSGATVRVVRSSNGAVSSSTANPYYIKGLAAGTSGSGFVVSIPSPTSYSGWSIRGSTYCLDACTNYNQQTTNYASGSSRSMAFFPGHVYNFRWIWQYLSPTTPALSGSVSGNTINLSWTASSQAGGAGIASYRVYNGATQVAGTTSRSYSTTFSCATSYAFTVKALDQYNHYSGASNAFAGTTPACAPPPATPKPAGPASTATPKPAATTVPAPSPAQIKPTTSPSTTTKPVAAAPKPGISTSAQSSTGTPDNLVPTTPEGFTAATSEGANFISLSWTMSTDASGIKGYNIERSTDRASWESLSVDISDTKFDDKTVSFNTHYYYRLTATDNAGNTSEYTLADASSPVYQQNAGSVEATLTSDDGVASVTLPADTTSSGAACSVVTSDVTPTLAKNQVVISGPYQLLCKDADGNQIQTFNRPLAWSYQFKTALKGYGAPIAASLDDAGKSVVSKSVYNKKLKTVSFSQTNGSQSLILASKKKGIPVNLIIGILLIIVLFIGVFFFVLRRRQQENYSDYIRSKYYDL